MNKRDLVTLVAQDSDYTRREVHDIISKTFEVILEQLKNDMDVRIINFGSFNLKRKKARRGYNPKSKQKIEIPEKVIIQFIPTAKFKKEINSRET